ncbi:MAG: trimethylamine--corrinoid methyltransferase, partial [Desulfobacteraceae bacterium]|nr:trimethylamine--corrinoid methyltransferase [Desulfobacteraceae bacterium]
MSEQVIDLLKAVQNNEVSFNFEAAKESYAEIRSHFPDSNEAKVAQKRLAVIDELIKEKQIYQRIDENAKTVLTDIGVNIAENQRLMDILMEADAVDFESETAVFLPLKRDYIEA